MTNDDAYRFAWEHARRNEDGSVVEESLAELLASLVELDEQKLRRGLAQRIIARRKRPGQTAPDGYIVLPGMDQHPYEPQRLLADDKGNVVENQHARLQFKVAEAARAQEDAKKAFERQSREQNEANHFAIWVADQAAAGRDPSELTWENCVRETGLWKDEDAEPDDPDDSEDES